MQRLAWILLIMLATVARGAGLGQPLVFTGTCDSSAAIALSGNLFVVANDEDSVLRFYRTSQPGRPVQTFDLKPMLFVRGKSSETDLEGAARLGQRVFFISSHGRNAEGKPAPNRHRFFAVEFNEGKEHVSVQMDGQPYTSLVTDLARDPNYAGFDLAEAADLPPKAAGGLNIEALTATPAGTLLIGFRSPIPGGRALLAPLLNPNEVITGATPNFGAPYLLDLGGLGLRGMTATGQGYYILAGPANGPKASRLFFWAGGTASPKVVSNVHFSRINPEGICLLDLGGASDFLIVSDDGTRKLKGKECKSLPESERRFRACIYTP
jgi:hypothetical protein